MGQHDPTTLPRNAKRTRVAIRAYLRPGSTVKWLFVVVAPGPVDRSASRSDRRRAFTKQQGCREGDPTGSPCRGERENRHAVMKAARRQRGRSEKNENTSSVQFRVPRAQQLSLVTALERRAILQIQLITEKTAAESSAPLLTTLLPVGRFSVSTLALAAFARGQAAGHSRSTRVAARDAQQWSLGASRRVRRFEEELWVPPARDLTEGKPPSSRSRARHCCVARRRSVESTRGKVSRLGAGPMRDTSMGPEPAGISSSHNDFVGWNLHAHA